jgi:type I restriction enzyme S subunit
LLSVGELGVYPQTESNKKDSSNEDKSKYKRICPGDIGYNTMRMWQGRSALSALEGIVSPAYTIVTPKENASAVFFAYLFKTETLVHLFFRKSQGLVSDTLNCNFKDFKIVKVETPPSIGEQHAIAKFLDQANNEMKGYEQKLATLQLQKKVLMQKLLTGEIRVKTN